MTVPCAECSTPVPFEHDHCEKCGTPVPGADRRGAATETEDSGFERTERLLREDLRPAFVLEGRLGRGGMAVVYAAQDVKLKRRVAIKVLPVEKKSEQAAQRFEREQEVAAKLEEHENIITIYTTSSSKAISWYAMTLVDGQSLDKVIEGEGRFSVARTIRILKQVAAALDHAHDKDVIHRDVKPANVMLDKREKAIVTDFGIAKPLDETTLTLTGQVFGTPHYMAPEQAASAADTASDQYSVAVMAYEMLSGQRPFDADSSVRLLSMHQNEAPPSLRDLRPAVPEYACAAIYKALSKDPSNRFETVTALVEGLATPWKGYTAFTHPTAVTKKGRKSGTRVYGAPDLPGTSAEPAGWVKRSVLITSLVVAGLVVVLGGGWQLWTLLQRDNRLPEVAEPLPRIDTVIGTAATPRNDRQPEQPRTPPAGGESERPAAPVLGALLLRTQGGWANIYLDDQFKRQGNVFRDSLLPGTHVVRLQRDGFETIDTTVTIATGRQSILALVMRRQNE